MHLPRRPGIGLMAREPALPFGRALRHAALFGGEAERGAQFGRRLHHDDMDACRHAALDLAQQVGMHDQRLGAAVAQDVAGLVGLVVPVDRAGIAAGLARHQHRFEEGDLVAQHDRHDVAFADAELAERGHAAQRALGDRRAVALSACRNDRSDHRPPRFCARTY